MHDDLVKRRTCGLLAATATAALFLGAQPATAEDSGPTTEGDVCMQQVYGGDTVEPKNRLNCTANDVSVARAVAVSPATCTAGEIFDLTATFEVVVTASERYDIGFFFRTDGGDDARDPSGICSLSALSNPPATPGLDLDGDTCGDLTSSSASTPHLATFTIEDVECVGVPDPADPDSGQLVLKLPNCTSWHSNQGTVCQLTPAGQIGDPTHFRPETKSKCACDDDFTVPVVVETAALVVTKDATPTNVFEPGQPVDFRVTVKNDSQFEAVVIDFVDDDPYGNVADPTNPAIISTDCDQLIDQTLDPQQTLVCNFSALVTGNAGESKTDIVEVCGTQTSTQAEVCDDDPETVNILDFASAPVVDKQGTVQGCTVAVDYDVTVNNPSDFDSLTVTSLEDDLFGDITTVQGDVIATDCDLPISVAPNSYETCTFTAEIVDDDCDFSHTDFVTAEGADDDDSPFSVQSNTVRVNGAGTSVLNP